MLVRSEQKANIDKNLDEEIFNHFLEKLRGDRIENILATFSLMNDGYSSKKKTLVGFRFFHWLLEPWPFSSYI